MLKAEHSDISDRGRLNLYNLTFETVGNFGPHFGPPKTMREVEDEKTEPKKMLTGVMICS